MATTVVDLIKLVARAKFGPYSVPQELHKFYPLDCIDAAGAAHVLIKIWAEPAQYARSEGYFFLRRLGQMMAAGPEPSIGRYMSIQYRSDIVGSLM
jgi:hypothetical protein